MLHIFKEFRELWRRVRCIERQMQLMAANQKDLDDAIAGLPAKIEAAVEAAVKPIIDALNAKAAGQAIDFQPEIDKLNSVGGAVADQIAKDLNPPA